MSLNKVVKKLHFYFEKTVSFVLVTIVFSMLFFSVTAIALRWAQQSNLWIDPLVRHLVFLSAFFGGVMATGRGTHISIDILLRYLESRDIQVAIEWVRRIIFLISLFVTMWLFSASVDFMKIEFQYGKEAFLGIHTGFLVGMTPIGFGLIWMSYLFQLLLTFVKEPN